MRNNGSPFHIIIFCFEGTSFLGLLGGAPAGTALFATGLRTALGRTSGRLPLASLLGGGLPARGTSLGCHGTND